MNREEPALEIEQTRGEFCRLSGGGDAVLVYVPVRVIGSAREGEMTLRFVIGPFVPGETTWSVRTGFPAILSFEIPRRFFLRGERLVVGAFGVAADGKEEVLWRRCYQVGWSTTVPQLEPVTIRSS